MIVVQLLTANNDPPRNDVATGIRQVIVAITQKVADAVDHARSPERNPYHLYNPDRKSGNDAENQNVDYQKNEKAEIGMLGIDPILQPIVRRAFPVLVQNSRQPRRPPIQKQPAPKHFVDPHALRTVGVFIGFHRGVMLAMHRDPFLGDNSGCQPQPESEKMTERRVET